MTGNHNEDEAWRSIVENYGDRPQVEDYPEPPPAPEPFVAYVQGEAEEVDEVDRFVPPPPPPLPHPPPARLIAWLGIFGAPAVLLVALVAAASLPTIVGYALVAWFIGGFTYLVITMDKGPRDPGDDGARL